MPNRVEREIEEILNKLDAPTGGRPPLRMRRSWRMRLKRATSRIPIPRLSLIGLNPGTMMLWGIGLILASFFLRMVSSELTRWAVIIGLILFFGSFVLSFMHKDAGSVGGGGDAYWRGQRFPRSELRGPSSIDRLKGWWRRRIRRPR